MNGNRTKEDIITQRTKEGRYVTEGSENGKDDFRTVPKCNVRYRLTIMEGV
jgi:hypothetical protein